MAMPGNPGTIIRHLRRSGKRELTLDQLLMLAGGDDADWGAYLRGAKAAAIRSALNTQIAMENRELVSIGEEVYELVNKAEAHRRRAQRNLDRATRPMQIAFEQMEKIRQLAGLSAKVRDNVDAWFELYAHDQLGLKHEDIFQSWAGELWQALPKPMRTIKGL